MVGDHHAHAEAVGFVHALHAGDAVVHGDEQVGLQLHGQTHDLRRQAVTELEAIRHDEAHLCCGTGLGLHGAQPAQAHCAGGGAIAVVVGHDDNALTRFDGVGNQFRRFIDVAQLIRCDQAGEALIQFRLALDAARRHQACHERMHAVLDQLVEMAGRNGAGGDAGG